MLVGGSAVGIGVTYLGSEFTIVDVEICAADSGGFYFDLFFVRYELKLKAALWVAYQNIVLTNAWETFVDDAELSSFAVLFKFVKLSEDVVRCWNSYTCKKSHSPSARIEDGRLKVSRLPILYHRYHRQTVVLECPCSTMR